MATPITKDVKCRCDGARDEKSGEPKGSLKRGSLKRDSLKHGGMEHGGMSKKQMCVEKLGFGELIAASQRQANIVHRRHMLGFGELTAASQHV